MYYMMRKVDMQESIYPKLDFAQGEWQSFNLPTVNQSFQS
jgi:hypothetical protein